MFCNYFVNFIDRILNFVYNLLILLTKRNILKAELKI